MMEQFEEVTRLGNYGSTSVLGEPEGWIGKTSVSTPFKGIPMDPGNLFKGFAVKLLQTKEIPTVKNPKELPGLEKELRDRLLNREYDNEKHRDLLEAASRVFLPSERVHPVLSNGLIGLFKGVTRTERGLEKQYAVVCQSGIKDVAERFVDSLYKDPKEPELGFRAATWGEFFEQNSNLGNLRNFSKKTCDSLIQEFSDILKIKEPVLPVTSHAFTHDIYMNSDKRTVTVTSDALPVDRVRGGFLLAHSHPKHGLTFFLGDPQQGRFYIDNVDSAHEATLCCSNGKGSLVTSTSRTPVKFSDSTLVISEEPLHDEEYRKPNISMPTEYVTKNRELKWGHVDLRPKILVFKQ